MKIRILKSKLTCRVTGCKEDYDGSVTIDWILAHESGIEQYEEVFVHGKKNRIRTYALICDPVQEGYTCQLNGNAVHYFEPGDKIHILAFGEVKDTDDDWDDPKIVKTSDCK